MTLRALAPLALIVLAAVTAGRANAQPDLRALEAIPWPSAFDNPEQRLVEMRLEAEQALKENRREDAATAFLRVAGLSRQLGLAREQIDALLKAGAQAAGTPLALPTDLLAALAVSRTNLEAGAPGAAWGDAMTVRDTLSRPGNEALRRRLEGDLLGLRFDIIVSIVGVIGSDRSASTLPVQMQALLVSILRDVDTANPAPDAVAWLDTQRPWGQALVRKAVAVHLEHLDLVRGLTGLERIVAEAQAITRGADLLAMAGRWPKAVELKMNAIRQLEASGQYSDGLRALVTLADFYDVPASGAPYEAARKASLQILDRVERQALRMGGHTLDAFLTQYERPYRRLYHLLRLAYDQARRDSAEPGLGATVPMLLQADRTNLRGARRDLVVYRTLGETLASDPVLLARFKARQDALRGARAAVDEAAAEGKDPADYRTHRASLGVWGEGPFAAYEGAKLDLVGALEDVKRRGLGAAERVAFLPLGWSQILKGMTASEAVVMYVQEPGTDALLAAVITVTEPTVGQRPDPTIRLRRLDGAGAVLPALVRSLRERLAVGADPGQALEEIARVLWHPLGDLPTNLTILLTPGVLGIPFEALPAAGGLPVIDRHTVRYAFGLQEGLGTYPRPAAYRRALVAGAEDFSRVNLPPLPSSRREVETVRALLRQRGVDVAPAEALPRSGRALLGVVGRVDVAHVSTHSVLDSTTPLIDALLFAADELPAYELAVSSLRADLLVLSACELFGARRHTLYPVSGVATAALGRIAPQLVSALWGVNAEATEVFMRRFYEALLDEREPALALAKTKRDFMTPARLAAWMVSSGVTQPAARRLATYHHAATWAAFVLVVAPLPD